MIQKLLTLCVGLVSSLTQGYQLLGLNYTSTRLSYKFCEMMYPPLKDTLNEVIDEMNNLNTFQVKVDEMSENTICNLPRQPNGQYAYLQYYTNTNKTDIVITNDLLFTPNTLYNTLLHEFTHSFGLNHTTTPGIMNYSLVVNQGRVKNDDRRLYLSQDDIQGIRTFYKQITGENRCRKKQILNLLRDCH